jgi:hypothetical protein
VSKLVKSATRPKCLVAIEQTAGVWLASDDAKELAPSALEITAATIPMPEGNGRRMLRWVPAGMDRIEVVAGLPIGVVLEVNAIAEPIEDVIRVG